MKKTSLRIVSLSLAASLLAGCGLNNTDYTSVDAVDQSIQQIATVAAISKTQASNPNNTVYVLTSSEGEVSKVFDNNESDLPVDIKITYLLDGKEISPEDLAGKSGHVTIRFNYTNNAVEQAEINEVKENLYVPFAVVSGVVLDDKKFTNVEVVNGKLVDDGNRTVALGLSFPGLSSNLNISKDVLALDIPEYVEISADVKDFSLEMTLSIVTNEVFSDLEENSIANVDDFKDALDRLNDAMSQILDGSAAIYEGLDTLSSKVVELGDGVTALYNGSTELKNGAEKLSEGSAQLSEGAAKLSDGAKELVNGLNTLTSNNDALNGAAEQVFNTLLATASSQLKGAGFDVDLTIDNYTSVLNTIIASLDSDAVYQTAYNQVSAAVEANNDQIVAGVTASVKQNVTANVTASVRVNVEAGVKEGVLNQMGLTEEAYNGLDSDTKATVDAAIQANTAAKMETPEIQAVIEANVNTAMASDDVQNIIATNIAAQKQALINENMASPQVQSQLQAAAAGVSTLTVLKASLDSYNQFYVGLKTYTAGVSKAAEGAGKLSSGASSLSNGANTLNEGAMSLYNGTVSLNNGLATLNESMPTLQDGVNQLRDGAHELNDGLIRFNDEGISKINDVITNDIESVVERFKASVEVSKNYRANNSDSENSSVKFIYRSDSIN